MKLKNIQPEDLLHYAKDCFVINCVSIILIFLLMPFIFSGLLIEGIVDILSILIFAASIVGTLCAAVCMPFTVYKSIKNKDIPQMLLNIIIAAVLGILDFLPLWVFIISIGR